MMMKTNLAINKISIQSILIKMGLLIELKQKYFRNIMIN